MERNKTANDDYRSGPGADTPWLEWLASGVGLLLTLCVFGFIGWQALDDATSTPVITIETTNVTSVTGGYHITFQAHNTGGAAASQVRVEGVLTQSNGSSEASDVVFDYIAGHSSRQGGLFFTQDPQAGDLSLRAVGFAAP